MVVDAGLGMMGRGEVGVERNLGKGRDRER